MGGERGHRTARRASDIPPGDTEGDSKVKLFLAQFLKAAREAPAAAIGLLGAPYQEEAIVAPDDRELISFPAYNGHSIGHFEGDTLVIHTAGFNEKTFLDATGAPHTDEMSTMERIRRISPTELEDVITIHDPQYYTRDWQARFVYKLRNDIRLEDYVCGEPHRDLASVAGVRRP